MKTTQVPKRLIIAGLIALALFALGQLTSILFKAESAYDWFRSVVTGS